MSVGVPVTLTVKEALQPVASDGWISNLGFGLPIARSVVAVEIPFIPVLVISGFETEP